MDIHNRNWLVERNGLLNCLKMLVEKYGFEIVGDLTPAQAVNEAPNVPHHLANPSIVKLLARKK